ncbi:histidine-type phosphatase [Erwinia endophytica]|uniref:histidine-type phosphatase n=1 Tax=Erwinia endophytica TaxID=1563158 RepID=UPI00126604A9|nr:histidine-type phosphatase [Erwinia endophytica]KAB8310056.1 histidine-type phosphatase [Erwinia endophytica]
MPDFSKTALMLAAALTLSSLPAHAADHYTLEKVVEVSRHGIRPPSEDDRTAIEAGTARPWARWLTPDGELTGHGYTAVWLKGRYESQRYRQLGLLQDGCPASGEFYVRASPMQRTRATAKALTEAAFPGCSMTIHREEKNDPLFQYLGGKSGKDDAEVNRQQALKALGGDLAATQQRLQPQIAALKQAVCLAGRPCPAFSQPWQLMVWSNGSIGIKGLDTLATMAETIRLEWSENQPLSQVAFGHAHNAKEVARLLPLLSAKYDYTNDLLGPAQHGASLLMDQIAKALQQGVTGQQDAPPDVRWLLYVAHDINISRLRTLLDFHWQQDLYPAGNIPPGGSLVFERWRDDHQQRFIRIYFQSQSLDQLQQLMPLSQRHPPLLTELHFRGCEQTRVGTLCPYDASLQRIEKNIDRSLIVPINYPQ